MPGPNSLSRTARAVTKFATTSKQLRQLRHFAPAREGKNLYVTITYAWVRRGL